jgi:hypothetical protein
MAIVVAVLDSSLQISTTVASHPVLGAVGLCYGRDRRRPHLLHDELELVAQDREDISTPSCPNAPNPQMYGRPMPMEDAPSAIALKMSVPRRIHRHRSPECDRYVPCTTSGSDVIVARIEFSARPPWFEQNKPSTPRATASSASSQ